VTRVYQEKQRAEIKEIAALKEKALLQERLHDEELQRLEYSRVNERLEHHIATLDSFKTVFDHQLKNYLLSIGTTAALCLFRDTVGEKDKADLELIIAASNLGSEVCYNQQVLRDITSERYQQKASPTCIYDMLANVCARQVRMLNTEPEKRVVLVDSNLATHIVSNGVSNAAKYGSNEKKPTLAFQLIEKQNENTCELVVVIENKKGEQHLALQAACDEDGRIYFTEDRSTALPRASKSSGFGSTIIYRCTRLMGGTCYLQVLAEMTKFVLKVPVTIVEVPTAPLIPDVQDCGPLVPASSMTLLKFAVIDDSALVARVCTNQIKHLFGCDCQWLQPEGTLADLKACIESTSPDILLVDNDLGAFGSGESILAYLQRATRCFNGVAISYSGNQTNHQPYISKATRGQDLGLRLQQIWSSFILSKKLAGKRILLVDDKDLHVHLETSLLHQERAVTTRFRDGTELLAAVEQAALYMYPTWPFDAVVLDQTMETLDGLPTLKRLPQSFKADVPIIIYSTEDSLQEQYLAAGAVQYVEKRPGSHRAICAVLGQLLGK